MKNKLIGLFGVLAIVIGFGSVAVKANPLEFLIENSTTGSITATTTALGYMTPGTGTTTIPAYDTFNYGNADQYATNNLALALQFTGSTTPASLNVATTTYNVAIEYSQDNVDWYSDASKQFATTTVMGWQTTGGKLTATTTKELLILSVPSRYVRAIVSIPQGSTNGSVWAYFIGQKQTPR